MTKTTLEPGRRIRVTHTTGITETATVDSITRDALFAPAVYVTYDDGTNGRLDLRAAIEVLS